MPLQRKRMRPQSLKTETLVIITETRQQHPGEIDKQLPDDIEEKLEVGCWLVGVVLERKILLRVQ
jgi:hypothetical protein